MGIGGGGVIPWSEGLKLAPEPGKRTYLLLPPQAEMMGQKQIVPFTKIDTEVAGILTFLGGKSNIFKQFLTTVSIKKIPPCLAPTLTCGENPPP